MKFRARKSFRFGPFRWNWTQRGPSSWTFRLGPFSHNFTTKRNTIDTPGPGSVIWGGKPGRRSTGQRCRP